jgi:hypothetical protein
MFNLTHTLNELYILTKLNWRKHALMLLIYALYVMFIHYAAYEASLGITQMLLIPYHFLTTAPLLILAMVIALDVFKQLRDPVGGIQYLLTPSSSLDKFAATWIYSFLMVFGSFVIVYDLSHILSVLFFNNFTSVHFTVLHESEQLSTIGLPTNGIPFLFQNWHEFKELTLIYMGVHAYFLLGSAFFRKNPFLRTVLVLIGLSILKSIGGYFLLKAFGVEVTIYNRNGKNIFIDFPEQLQQTFNGINDFMTVALPLLAWYLTYEVLKRKQV